MTEGVKMNSKTVCVAVLTLFAILQLGYAIKCYRCENESSCKKAKQYECNETYGNETMKYLDAYFQNVNTNTTSKTFVCMRQDIKFSISGTVKYKGCLYSHINSCGYKFRNYFEQTSTVFSCSQCNNKDGCNPADRKSVSVAAIGLPVIFALIYKYLV